MISLYRSLDDVLFEMVFAPQKDLIEYLRSLNIEVEEENEILYCKRDGFGGGFSIYSDPVTKAAMLGFLVVGERWASIAPNLLEKVDKEWGKRHKKDKQNLLNKECKA
jgi:hypothetical protein